MWPRLDAGIVHMHTSSSYAEQNHERMPGRALRGRPHDSFILRKTNMKAALKRVQQDGHVDQWSTSP